MNRGPMTGAPYRRFACPNTVPPAERRRPRVLHADVRGLDALDAGAGHVRPRLAERPAGVDPACGVLDDQGLEAGLARVERRPRHAEIGGEPDEEHAREPALLQVARQARLRLPVGLEKRGVRVHVLPGTKQFWTSITARTSVSPGVIMP